MTDNDPFLWLEDVDGPAVLAWVREQNARSLALLESDPRYFGVPRRGAARSSPRPTAFRIRSFLGDDLVNFWQDEAHVRGLWRRTTLDSFRAAEPRWETLLDIDALAAAEGRNWVFHGGMSLPPEYRRCLVALSDGGKDAVGTARVRSRRRRALSPAASALPEGKQSASLARRRHAARRARLGAGHDDRLRLSVHPEASAPRCSARRGRGDVSRDAQTMSASAPACCATPTARFAASASIAQINFFDSERYLLTDAAPVRLPVPPQSSFRGFVAGQLVFSLEEDWREIFQAGALVSLDLAACPAEIPIRVEPVLIVMRRGRAKSIEGVAATRDRLLVTIYRNVQGSAVSYRFDGGAWCAHAAGAAGQRLDARRRGQRPATTAPLSMSPGFLDAEHAVSRRRRGGERGAGQVAAGAFRCRPPIVVEQFEATRPTAPRSPISSCARKRLRVRRRRPDAALRLWRLPGVADPVLFGARRQAVARAGRRLCGGQYPRRRRVRPGLAPGGAEGAPPARLRRFHRGRRGPDRRGITSPRRLGIMGGSNGGLLMGVDADAAAGPVPRRRHPGAAARHAALSQAARRRLVDGRIRRPRRSRKRRRSCARISPYQNLRPGVDYPEPFFVTSTKDDRVHPGHARKMAAKMAGDGPAVPLLREHRWRPCRRRQPAGARPAPRRSNSPT